MMSSDGGTSSISETELKKIQKAIYECHSNLEENTTLVALFGPFSSKYTTFDVDSVDSSLNEVADKDATDILHNYATETIVREEDTLETQERDLLSNVRENLRDLGYNAFVAGSVPPFRGEDWDDEHEQWQEYLDDEDLIQEWTYINQSYQYSRLADIVVFVFTYFGNPVGVTYELADITRGAVTNQRDEILEKSLIYYQHDDQFEDEIRMQLPNLDSRTIDYFDTSIQDGPKYLSAMVQHVEEEYGFRMSRFTDVEDLTFDIYEAISE